MTNLAITGGGRAWVGVVGSALTGVWMAVHGAPALASSLLAPAVGAADSATVGTRVADPQTPSAALFENPAGLSGFETFTHGGGLGLGFGRARIEASMPAGFSETEEPVTVVPDFGASVPSASVGASLWECTGARDRDSISAPIPQPGCRASSMR